MHVSREQKAGTQGQVMHTALTISCSRKECVSTLLSHSSTPNNLQATGLLLLYICVHMSEHIYILREINKARICAHVFTLVSRSLVDNSMLGLDWLLLMRTAQTPNLKLRRRGVRVPVPVVVFGSGKNCTASRSQECRVSHCAGRNTINPDTP